MNSQRELLPPDASEQLEPGAAVLLLLPQPQLMKFVNRALFLPALILVICVWIGHSIAITVGYSTDIGALAGIISGVVCGLILARKQCRKLELDTRAEHHAQLQLVLEVCDR